ncbi:MAG: hypothetical protein ABI895_32210 [Deltaproteobacteria bacterium]
MNRSLQRLTVALAAVALAAVACGGTALQATGGAGPGSGGPGWIASGDRADAHGSTFVCQGEGSTEEEALTTARGICNDKVCRLCGVEVESVVQTTETLKGVSMQRKVVERCRQFRKAPLAVEHKSTDCGPSGCTAWLGVSFSKEQEKAECTAYSSEHFADSGECERLIEEFRSSIGRTAASLRARTQLLDAALGACAGIDVRPTPLLDALQEKLRVGMTVFEFTPEQQQARTEEPFFDTTWYKSRTDMMEHRGATDFYLTTYGPLQQEFRETKTLVARIQLVRDYVYNRALVFDVIEATGAADLDSARGIARLLATLQAAPPGVQYGSGDVHFYCMYTLRDLAADINPINEFYRRSYPPQSLYWNHGIPLAALMAKDGRVDKVEWAYIFDLHRAHSCEVCLQQLLRAPDHGGRGVREERFTAVLDLDRANAKSVDERRRTAAALMPPDTEFLMHARATLPAELQPALDWKFLLGRVEQADDADDLDGVQRLLPVLAAALQPPPGSSVPESYCLGLADKLAVLAKRGVSLAPVADAICACLTGPLAAEGTRILVNKSDLYDYALAQWLACVRPH